MGKTIRHSKKRDAIFNALCNTDSHPSAETIYRMLKPDIPDLSLGTVYRNLSHFRQEGTAVSIGVVRGQERYDGNTNPHAHFICGQCGVITDIINPDLYAPLIDGAAEMYGFEITGCELVFHGTCNVCCNLTEEE